MMPIENFLSHLERLNIHITLLGQELDVNAPKGILTPEIVAQIKGRKQEILNLLHTNAGVSAISRGKWQPGDRLPLSFAQQHVWLISQLQPDSPVLNIRSARRLRGRLDINALQNSLNLLVERHLSLRTTFELDADLPVQIIHEPRPIQLVWIECADEESAHRALHEQAEKPFDLTVVPLLRAVLLRLEADHHILLLTVHHISTDEWSQDIFWREMVESYTTFSRGIVPHLPPTPIEYVDFAVWQRATMIGDALQQHMDYWSEHLDDVPTTLELPTDHPCPVVPSGHGAEVHIHLDSDLTRRLITFAREQNTTQFTVLMASFTLLIGRYSRQKDFVVGTPVAGRIRLETENVLGLFSNILALHVRMIGSFSDLVAQIGSTTLDAISHVDLPFDQYVHLLPKTRHASSSPSIQATFLLRSPHPAVVNFPDLEISQIAIERTTAKFDLMLMIRPTDNGMQAVFEYNTDIFEASTIERMAEHWVTLLRSALENPQQPVLLLAMMNEAEQRRILYEWNATTQTYPRDLTLAQRFEVWVARTPDAVALIEGESSLTYAELDAAANGVALMLQQMSVQPEVPVGVYLPRSTQMLIATLGVIKAGGAVVPLDVYYPLAHLSFLMRDSGVEIILTAGEYLSNLAESEMRVIDLATCVPRADRPVSTATAESLLQIIYTSGSTGTPKGIEVTHRNVMRLVCNANYVSFGPSEKMLHLSSISFDAASFEIWGSLLNGGTLVIYPERYIDYGDIAALIHRHAISILFLTTSLFHQMVDHDAEMLAQVGQVLAGGEVLSPAHALRAQMRGIDVTNAYGPSENTTFTAFYKVTGHENSDIPIGRPITNTQVYILDDALNPVPTGVVGELYAGGDGVARGYRNRPDLTAERFITHAEYGRLYRTGDSARWRPDGNIAFLGRKDFQIKVRGFRIEPDEIEQAILRMTGVKEAVVVAHEAIQGERQLVAYVVGSATIDSISTYLRGLLPHHMIPGMFVAMDALPLTVNGKLNRAALPVPEQRLDAYAGPKTDRETELTTIWEGILKQDGIGIHDDFFAIGGDSLKAAQITAAIERQLNISMRVIALFHAPTIAQLAVYISAGQPESPESIVVLLQKGDDPLRPPLFMIHGVGGEVLNYVPLAQRLASKPSVYGLQAERLEDLTAIPTMEGLAAQYIEAIRAIQPHGPYFLSGHSFGGWLAYEMAQQLLHVGEEIGLLALVDTSAKYSPDSPFDRLSGRFAFQVRRVTSHARVFLTSNPGAWMKYVRVRWTRFRQRQHVYRSYKAQQLEQPYNYRQEIMAFAPQIFQQQADIYRLVGRAYHLQPYPGKLVIFVVRRYGNSIFHRQWLRTAKCQIIFRSIPGNHITLLEEPYVQTLAAYLDQYISS